MHALYSVLPPRIPHDIQAIGVYAKRHVDTNWKAVLAKNTAKLDDAFARGGDMAYGTYLGLLLRPLMRSLAGSGLTASPRLPGQFDISREWGNSDETQQQRWMWSLVLDSENRNLGTLVTVIHHDHSRFRLPQPPEIFAIAENTKQQIVEALSQRSDGFREALEFNEWYANYLREHGQPSTKETAHE